MPVNSLISMASITDQFIDCMILGEVLGFGAPNIKKQEMKDLVIQFASYYLKHDFCRINQNP